LRESVDAPLARKGQECALLSINAPTAPFCGVDDRRDGRVGHRIGSGRCVGCTDAVDLGVPNVMITKHRWTANTPRAHLINQRALEVFRDMGIEDQIHHDAAGHELVGDTVVCTSLAGEEIGRIHAWGTHPDREADYQRASPCLSLDLPQNYLEPILVRNATTRGTHTRFSTEYLSLDQDSDESPCWCATG